MLKPDALADLMASDAPHAVLDVRERGAYERGHVYRSTTLPRRQVEWRLPTLVTAPATPIVVHCGGRTRSYIGAESLRRMRLPNPIVALENGTMGWELAGLTLERGANRTAPAPGSRSHGQAAATAKRVAVEDGVRFLGVDDVRRLWDGRRERNVYLVDVRTADEYEADHVAGSIWAPGGQAVQATDDYFAVRGASYVFICDGFVRSVMTAAWFTRMGVPDVAVLAGGVSAWRDGGGLIESGQPAPAPFGWDAARAAARYRKPGDLGAALVVDVGMSDAYPRGREAMEAYLRWEEALDPDGTSPHRLLKDTR